MKKNISFQSKYLRKKVTSKIWKHYCRKVPNCKYSLWWIIILSDYYLYTGDRQFLEENAEYLTALVRYLESLVDSDGNICFPESSDKYFLDWATYCKQERQREFVTLKCVG